MPTATSSVKIDLSSLKKTEKLAVKISEKLKPGNIVFLYGEMGVGKTTLIKHIIQEFQKKNKLKQTEVTSPTFNLLNEYQIKKIKINHYDLFRLKSNEELKNNLSVYSKNVYIPMLFWIEDYLNINIKSANFIISPTGKNCQIKFQHTLLSFDFSI